MNIIDNTNSGNEKCCRDENSMGRNIYFGAILISLGTVWLLNNFDVVNKAFFDAIFSWQMLITIIGGYILSLRNWVSGGIVTGVGIILFGTRIMGIDIPMEKLFIPLIFIAAGVAIIGSRLCKR